jgi:hypothetical protein
VPVSGDVGSHFAGPVAYLLADHELKLLESAALTLRGDQSSAAWEATSLSRIATWRSQAERGVPGATEELMTAVRVALLGAYAEGAAEALVDLPGDFVAFPAGMRGLLLNEKRLGAKLAAALQAVPRMLELVLREAVRAGVQEVREGKSTRRQASQRALDSLVRQGITGFRDSAGRNWSLSSYTEMAVRTEVQAAALAAGEENIRAAGLGLVFVSDSPRECGLCAPFEGRVLGLEPLSKEPTPDPEPPTDAEVYEGMRAAEAERLSLEREVFDAKGNYNAAKGWTSQTRKAYTSYTEMGYTVINAIRRGDPAAALKAAFDDPEFLEEFVVQGQTFENVVGQSTLFRDVVVARGDTRDLSHVQPGSVIEEPGFMSASSNLAEAQDFADGRPSMNGGDKKDGWLLIINAPKGSHAVAGADYQNEIIFQAGSRLRVTAVDRPRRRIYATLEQG